MFDSLDVVIGLNTKKNRLLTPQEAQMLLEKQTSRLKQVRVCMFDGLIADYCRREQASVLLRGIRSSADFDYEFELSLINRQLNRDIETVLLPVFPEYTAVRSSAVKELIRFGGDFSSMVTPEVREFLLTKGQL